MLILGVLVLVPAAIVFWRMRDRAVMAPPPPSVPQKVIGASTLHPNDPRPGKEVDKLADRSDRRP
jgi:hypothetical protein